MTEKTTLTREEFAELISQRNSYYKAWKEAEKKLSEAQAIIEQQKKTFIAALNNATKISSTELQIAERLKAESSPEALESERAANAILTEELEKARAEIEILKNQLEDESMRADGMTTAHAEAGADSYRMRELIEQMRDALSLILEGAIHDFHYICQRRDNCLCWGCQKKRVKAALSAAERGEG